jgi:hypothetical protein
MTSADYALGEWKIELHSKAGFVVVQLEMGLVELGYGGDQAQAQASAGCGSAGIEAVEALEYPLASVCRYSWTVVGDNEANLLTFPCRGQAHPPSRRDVLEYVIDQVGDRLEEQITITLQDQILLMVGLQAEARLFQ